MTKENGCAIIMVILFTFSAASNAAALISDELQWLAMYTACLGEYNMAQTGDGNFKSGDPDPRNYYAMYHIREFLAKTSGPTTKTEGFYGICIDYAIAAYNNILQNRKFYDDLGMKKNGVYIAAALGNNDRQIILYDPGSERDHTIKVNKGEYLKEYARHNVLSHEGITGHAWLWVYGNDGTIYWIDPTWTDNCGYIWWGIVQDGKEIQKTPLKSLCTLGVDLNDRTFSLIAQGDAFRNKGNYNQAIGSYTKAIEANPNNAMAYYDRGLAYVKKNDWDRAIVEYNQAIKFDPNFAWSYNDRGGSYMQKRNFDRAILDFNQAIRLDPNLAEAYGNRGGSYILKGDFDRGIDDCTQAINKSNDKGTVLASFYANRGSGYARKGDRNRAIMDYETALRLDPNCTTARESLNYIRQKAAQKWNICNPCLNGMCYSCDGHSCTGFSPYGVIVLPCVPPGYICGHCGPGTP